MKSNNTFSNINQTYNQLLTNSCTACLKTYENIDFYIDEVKLSKTFKKQSFVGENFILEKYENK